MTDQDEDELDRLTERWWKYHARAGLLSKSDFDDEELSRIDEEVESMYEGFESLEALIGALVRAAPSQDEIPYIGTWVLEDIRILGIEIDAFEVTRSLGEELQRQVLSGYWPAPGTSPT